MNERMNVREQTYKRMKTRQNFKSNINAIYIQIVTFPDKKKLTDLLRGITSRVENGSVKASIDVLVTKLNCGSNP